MTRKFLLIAALAVFAGSAGANSGSQASLMFVGSIAQGGCDSGQPTLGMQGGMGGCGKGATRSVYAERTTKAADGTGVAMLDYFADRSDGARKYVVTRQYL